MTTANTEILFHGRKEFGLEINAGGKVSYIFVASSPESKTKQ